MKIQCAVCKREFEVTLAQFELMKKIGAITCSSKCALKWVENE